MTSPSLHVLLVDDHAAFRDHLRGLLAAAGFAVIGEAGDMAEAETLARALRPDLAVVDVMLPGVSGLEGTPRLKALLPALRVILISAHADEGGVLHRAALAAGAETFIPKDELDVSLVQTWKSGACAPALEYTRKWKGE